MEAPSGQKVINNTIVNNMQNGNQYKQYLHEPSQYEAGSRNIDKKILIQNDFCHMWINCVGVIMIWRFGWLKPRQINRIFGEQVEKIGTIRKSLDLILPFTIEIRLIGLTLEQNI